VDLHIYGTIFPPTHSGGPYLIVASAKPADGHSKLRTPITGTCLAPSLEQAVKEREALAASLQRVAVREGYNITDIYLD
jgi:hypothetical protein